MDVIPQAPSPWDVSPASFPREGSETEQLTFLVRYALLAPSTRNTQPWAFAVGPGHIDVHADLTRHQPVADPDQREIYISIGCAIENLVVAACHFGFRTAVDCVPTGGEPSLVARVRCISGGCVAPVMGDPRFEMIPRRRTNHGLYDNQPVAADELEAIGGVCMEAGLRLTWITDEAGRAEVDRLTMRADALLLSRAEYRQELGEIIGTGAFGTPWLLATLGRFAVAHLVPTSRFMAADHATLASAPVIGLLSAQVHTREAEVRVGQVLERIYLAATARGLSVQPVSQLMQTPETREGLSALLPVPGLIPLQPFRLGYAVRPGRHTPRRDLDDVLR